MKCSTTHCLLILFALSRPHTFGIAPLFVWPGSVCEFHSDFCPIDERPFRLCGICLQCLVCWQSEVKNARMWGVKVTSVNLCINRFPADWHFPAVQTHRPIHLRIVQFHGHNVWTTFSCLLHHIMPHLQQHKNETKMYLKIIISISQDVQTWNTELKNLWDSDKLWCYMSYKDGRPVMLNFSLSC